MPKIFISTAEASAELHASRLVEALFALHPDLVVDAAGTEMLAKAGANLAVDMAGKAVMGFWEAIAHLSFYRKAGDKIISTLANGGYDALILVDAPSFHLHIAKKIHARWPDLPIIYYIAPKLWAWKKWRIRNLRRDIAKTLCIFPFEEEYFRSQGVDAVYAGNPTLDQVSDLDGKELARRLGVAETDDPGRGLLAVFPGSRGSEVKYIWPEMVGAIGILSKRFPDLKFAVALAPGWTRERLEQHAAAPEGVLFVNGDSQHLLAASSAVLAKSGTTTLEAALLGKPMVVTYITHPVTFRIAKTFVKLPHVALPNILAGKTLVKELLQNDATAENMAAELERILADPGYYRTMRNQLSSLRKSLGDERASQRAAREVAAFFGKGHPNGTER